MKAPDKVYIMPMPNPSDGYVGIAWNKPIPKCETYIRKDALMEWVKEKMNINLEEADEKNDMFFYGVATGFAAMIDKLNLM